MPKGNKVGTISIFDNGDDEYELFYSGPWPSVSIVINGLPFLLKDGEPRTILTGWEEQVYDSLDDVPDWLDEAIEEHRRADHAD